ncbi:MAG: hypothetical protein ACHQ52_11090, partial [Candidatus Eisenbacteria bacterium]
MTVAKRLFVFLAVASLAAPIAGAALAAPIPEAASGYAGHAYVNATTGVVSWSRPSSPTATGVDVYSNVLSAANFGISSTDLTATWGDRVTTTGTGTLEEMDFSIYNSGSSAGPLQTVSFVIGYFDGTTFTNIGAFSTAPIDFGPGGLPAGFYTLITVMGLSPLAINLITNDVIVTQEVLDHTGAATRLGVASLDPPTIGSSVPTMYINTPTIGPPGFYTIANNNANPGYRINVSTPPTPT